MPRGIVGKSDKVQSAFSRYISKHSFPRKWIWLRSFYELIWIILLALGYGLLVWPVPLMPSWRPASPSVQTPWGTSLYPVVQSSGRSGARGILKNASFTLFRFLQDISGFFVTLFGAFFVTPTPGGTPSLMGWFFKVSPRSAILASSGSCVTLPVLAWPCVT